MTPLRARPGPSSRGHERREFRVSRKTLHLEFRAAVIGFCPPAAVNGVNPNQPNEPNGSVHA
jgi:hypothetical protein